VGAVVKFARQPLRVVGHEIASLWGKALFAGIKAQNMRVEVGAQLLVLRERVEKEAKVDWWTWYKHEGCFDGHTKRDAQKIMALAAAENPTAAVEQERAAARIGMRKQRARTNKIQPLTVSNVRRSQRLPNEISQPVKELLGHIRELTEQDSQQLFACLREEYLL